MKVYVVGGAINYTKFMSNVELTNNLEDAQVVLFTGGEDVDPSIYGKKKYHSTYSNLDRDLYEKDIFSKVTKKQLAVGICRGSQFLCAMNGGILVQDCKGHAIWETHPIYSRNDGMKYEITSTHHQMQYPFVLSNDKYEILYYANVGHTFYGDGIDSSLVKNVNPEVVLYHLPDKPKCLAIQGHPEMIPDSPVAKMLDKLIKKYVPR